MADEFKCSEDALGKVTVYFRHEGKEYCASIILEKDAYFETIHAQMKQLSESLVRTMIRVGAIKGPGGTNEDSSITGEDQGL